MAPSERAGVLTEDEGSGDNPESAEQEHIDGRAWRTSRRKEVLFDMQAHELSHPRRE